ncbi:hypothetical protein [Nostoc sp. FACHB-152]|uniref:hypothetical protein n=1 Tax=Nostoc sp. FACHB-152 TaxID=2692837 RepID=UPI0037C9A7D0
MGNNKPRKPYWRISLLMDNGKVRIYELSQELNLGINELLAICHQINIPVKSIISESEAESIRLQVNKLGVKSPVLTLENFENIKPDSQNWGYKFVANYHQCLIQIV